MKEVGEGEKNQAHTLTPPHHSTLSGPALQRLYLAISLLLWQPAPALAAHGVERASFLCNVIMHLLLPWQ